MKFKTALAIGFLILAAVACKKEEKEETSEYMSGGITIFLPDFVEPGYIIKADDISDDLYAGGNEIGYIVQDPYTGDRDTAAAFKYSKFLPYTIPDALGSFEFICRGCATGYYNASTTAEYTVVDPKMNGSIKGLGIDVAKDSCTIGRDGKKYYFMKRDGLDWLMQNVADESLGKPYNGCTATTDMFGHFYTREDAEKVCPEGWRLPTSEEWDGLTAGEIMTDATLNGERMWNLYPEVKITNAARLCVLPCGYAEVDEEGEYTFKGFKSYAIFWTSSECDGKPAYKCIYEGMNEITTLVASDNKSFAASVRCVR